MRKLALATIVALASAAVLLIVGPQRISMATTATGDSELSTYLREHQSLASTTSLPSHLYRERPPSPDLAPMSTPRWKSAL